MSLQLELFRLPPLGSMPPALRQHVMLGQRIIPYELRRDRRRLTLRIDERGLRVGAPRNIALAEIEAFICSHANWVLEKLDALAGDDRRHLSIHDGARLPVLGEEARVRVTTGANRGFWEDDILWLAARPGADLSAIARKALQRRILEYCRPRLGNAVARLDCQLPALSLSSARTRWGSCSTQTGIRLNWRLVHLPPQLIDYVIAHEAAHLVEMNHSPRFWNLVARLCPDWEAARQSLKAAGKTLPII